MSEPQSSVIRVLVADNNIELCQTLQEFLDSRSDMEVVGLAYDGEEALDKIGRTEPDVVILDITMPHLDGMAVLERLGDLGLSHRPHIIVLTALGREDIIQRFTDLGAEYFVIKPFNLELLADRIRQFAHSAPTVVNEPRETFRPNPQVEMETSVTKLLHQMGVPPHFKGYNYLRDAVLAVLHEENLLGGALTKRLYPQLAEKYSTTPGGVEAAIRNAVISAWDGGNREFLEQLSGFSGRLRKGKFPTNSMIIAKLADHVRLQSRAG